MIFYNFFQSSEFQNNSKPRRVKNIQTQEPIPEKRLHSLEAGENKIIKIFYEESETGLKNEYLRIKISTVFHT